MKCAVGKCLLRDTVREEKAPPPQSSQPKGASSGLK